MNRIDRIRNRKERGFRKWLAQRVHRSWGTPNHCSAVSSPSVSYPVHPVHPVKTLLLPFLLRLFPIPFILSIPSKLFSVRFFSVCFPSRSSCPSRQSSSPSVSSPSVSHPVHPVHPVKTLLLPFLLRLFPIPFILYILSKLFSVRFFSVCLPSCPSRQSSSPSVSSPSVPPSKKLSRLFRFPVPQEHCCLPLCL